MFTMDVSLPIAFGAGLISFFSPCILPMVPAYIMYITGASIEEDIGDRKLRALFKTMGFVIGFTLIFIIMGSTASFIGKLFIKNKKIIGRISGMVMILLGLNMLDLVDFDFLNKEKRLKLPKQSNSWLGPIFIGMAFAAGWTPCFGPVLGTILIYAGKTSTLSQGIFLLFIYSLGMAIPFIITTLFMNEFNGFMLRNDKYFKYIPRISGVLIIIFGLLIFFDRVIDISRLLV